MTEKINCPFCGNLIGVDDAKCSGCGALFQEPQLADIKFREIGPFIAVDLLTFGFFSTIWFYINAGAINRLADNKRDEIKLNWLILLLALNGGVYLFFFYKHAAFLGLFTLLQCIIYVLLSYRVLRIIQKHTEKLYDTEIGFNPYFMVIFNVLYLVHFIETYQSRVYHTHEYFDWKSPYAIMLIILLLIILFICRFGYEIYEYATYHNLYPFLSLN